MKKIVYFIFVFFQSLLLNSQEIVKVEMLDSSFNVIKTENFYIKRTVKTIENSTNFNVEEVWSTGEKYATYLVSDYNELLISGEKKIFFKNGNLKEIKNYKNGNLVGDYSSYYLNGKPQLKGRYEESINGAILFIFDFWDENGVHKVIDSNGEYQENLKDNIYRISIKNGRYHGVLKPDFIIYPYSVRYYENGNFVKGEFYKSSTNIRVYNREEISANPVGGIKKFRQDITDQLILKFQGKKINIDVLIKFEILTDGTLDNIVFLKSAGSKIDQKIEEILRKKNKWEPGIKNGIEVKSIFKFPIKLNISFE